MANVFAGSGNVVVHTRRDEVVEAINTRHFSLAKGIEMDTGLRMGIVAKRGSAP
ncbi:hypothetical protein [Streptomyces sp. NPDC005385]|uniref:hypothetical protein n=1 Tax=Streptomyces sp. NPDC005385 TaxID=3157039 RepID=UPI0033B8D722